MQAEALAAILAQFREEVATKQDLAVLRAELRAEIQATAAELKADLTWRFLALLAFFSTVMTLLDFYLD